MLEHFRDHYQLFCCPKCSGELKKEFKQIVCRKCQTRFKINNSIPLMFWPRQKVGQVTEKVKQFYETIPFPNYDGIESAADLINKAKQGIFAHWLEEKLPFNSFILDAGCGTGQLSNFLSLAQRFVFGTDMSLASLQLAQRFKQQNRLDRVGFYQMNLFQPIFKPLTFDVVICTGVLHHTADPKTGFMTLSRLVKPSGLIIIGLYHQWGRIINRLRRQIFKYSQGKWLWLDPQLKLIKDKDKFRAWFEDQYHHPHESVHGFKEVKTWFNEAGFSFVDSIPHTNFQSLLTGGREGGLFIMIGRKNNYVKNIQSR